MDQSPLRVYITLAKPLERLFDLDQIAAMPSSPRASRELDPGFVVKKQHGRKTAVYKPLEVIVKARLLLTSALLMLVQIIGFDK